MRSDVLRLLLIVYHLLLTNAARFPLPRCSPKESSSVKTPVDYVFVVDHTFPPEKLTKIKYMFNALSCAIPLSPKVQIRVVHVNDNQIKATGWESSKMVPQLLKVDLENGHPSPNNLCDRFTRVLKTLDITYTNSTITRYVLPIEANIKKCSTATVFRNRFENVPFRLLHHLDKVLIGDVLPTDVQAQIHTTWRAINTEKPQLTKSPRIEDVYHYATLVQQIASFVEDSMNINSYNKFFNDDEVLAALLESMDMLEDPEDYVVPDQTTIESDQRTTDFEEPTSHSDVTTTIDDTTTTEESTTSEQTTLIVQTTTSEHIGDVVVGTEDEQSTADWSKEEPSDDTTTTTDVPSAGGQDESASTIDDTTSQAEDQTTTDAQASETNEFSTTDAETTTGDAVVVAAAAMESDQSGTVDDVEPSSTTDDPTTTSEELRPIFVKKSMDDTEENNYDSTPHEDLSPTEGDYHVESESSSTTPTVHSSTGQATIFAALSKEQQLQLLAKLRKWKIGKEQEGIVITPVMMEALKKMLKELAMEYLKDARNKEQDDNPSDTINTEFIERLIAGTDEAQALKRIMEAIEEKLEELLLKENTNTATEVADTTDSTGVVEQLGKGDPDATSDEGENDSTGLPEEATTTFSKETADFMDDYWMYIVGLAILIAAFFICLCCFCCWFRKKDDKKGEYDLVDNGKVESAEEHVENASDSEESSKATNKARATKEDAPKKSVIRPVIINENGYEAVDPSDSLLEKEFSSSMAPPPPASVKSDGSKCKSPEDQFVPISKRNQENQNSESSANDYFVPPPKDTSAEAAAAAGSSETENAALPTGTPRFPRAPEGAVDPFSPVNYSTTFSPSNYRTANDVSFKQRKATEREGEHGSVNVSLST